MFAVDITTETMVILQARVALCSCRSSSDCPLLNSCTVHQIQYFI